MPTALGVPRAIAAAAVGLGIAVAAADGATVAAVGAAVAGTVGGVAGAIAGRGVAVAAAAVALAGAGAAVRSGVDVGSRGVAVGPGAARTTATGPQASTSTLKAAITRRTTPSRLAGSPSARPPPAYAKPSHRTRHAARTPARRRANRADGIRFVP
jgi:hypothetical protein